MVTTNQPRWIILQFGPEKKAGLQHIEAGMTAKLYSVALVIAGDAWTVACFSWTWLKNWRPPQWTTVSDQIGCQEGGREEHYLPETVRNGRVGHRGTH